MSAVYFLCIGIPTRPAKGAFIVHMMRWQQCTTAEQRITLGLVRIGYVAIRTPTQWMCDATQKSDCTIFPVYSIMFIVLGSVLRKIRPSWRSIRQSICFIGCG